MTREEQKKEFDRQRLALSDRIRRDDRLTGSFRTVGAELASRLSFSSGFADADQDYLAKKLGLSKRTVKMAVKALQLTGYFEIVRRGWTNRYRPVFGPNQGQILHLPENDQVQNLPLIEGNRGKKQSNQVQKSTPDQVQNLPLSTSLQIPFPSLSGGSAGEPASAPDGAGGSPQQNFERLRARLKQRLGEAVFAAWFGEKLRGADFAPDAVTLRYPTKFLAGYVGTHFERAILECAQADHPDLQRVIVTIGTAAPPAPKNPDARWLIDEGTALVSDAMGVTTEKAALALRDWLKRCGNDPAGLRRIVANAAGRGLTGDQFRDVLQAGTKELLFADQKKLPLPPMAVNTERKAS